MNRPLFGFRPNLQNERHRRAWEILQAVPDGQKNAFLVQAILESEEKESFETTLRRVLREELQAVPSQPVKQPEEAIPQEMMGFLGIGNNPMVGCTVACAVDVATALSK